MSSPDDIEVHEYFGIRYFSARRVTVDGITSTRPPDTGHARPMMSLVMQGGLSAFTAWRYTPSSVDEDAWLRHGIIAAKPGAQGEEDR